MPSKRSQHLQRSPGQSFFLLCLGTAIATGLGVFLWPYIFWGSIHLSLKMGWATWGETTTYEPWDGCISPESAAERDEWVNHAKTTGEPLCNPDIVEMTFPDEGFPREES